MSEYENLKKAIGLYQVQHQIHNENDLEIGLLEHLKRKGYTVERQKRIRGYRNDLVVTVNGKQICLELKVVAGIGCCRQIDNYIPIYKDGIIIVCWKSSSNLKSTVDLVKSKISQPIDIIEIRKGQSMV